MVDERVERIEGPTPNGGDYAVLYRGLAGGAYEIVEYKKDGTEVFRTYFDGNESRVAERPADPEEIG